MKKLTLTLLFSAFSLVCFAQTPFTIQTLNDNRQIMIADFTKFINENISPSFVFVNADGAVLTADQMKEAAKTVQMKALDYEKDVRIHQNGNFATVTGANTHTMVYAGKNSATYHVRFTYLFEFTDKKWKWATAQHTYLKNTEDPKEVYKQWVTEYNNDTKAFLMDKCPDDLRGTVNGGAFYDNSGFKNMQGGQKANLEPSDMKSFQSGNLAVIMGMFTKKQADGSDKKEVFTAVMQKRNGKWMYVGHHATDMKQ